jgi:hypothetical protein
MGSTICLTTHFNGKDRNARSLRMSGVNGGAAGVVDVDVDVELRGGALHLKLHGALGAQGIVLFEETLLRMKRQRKQQSSGQRQQERQKQQQRHR